MRTLGAVPGEVGRCVLGTGDGVLVGTAHARLARIRSGEAAILDAFDGAPGRETWYTPWGGPPDTRSLSTSSGGAVFANVHVGGILRSERVDGPWRQTIDVDADVHQVLADPADPEHVVAATAGGLAESRDGGDRWAFVTEGLHAPYARAVALDGERLFLSASTGPRGGRAAVYRRDRADGAFVRCDGSLPGWFAGNVDTHCLAAAEGAAVFGTEDGRLFVSEEGGGSWSQAAEGLGRVRCVAIGP